MDYNPNMYYRTRQTYMEYDLMYLFTVLKIYTCKYIIQKIKGIYLSQTYLGLKQKPIDILRWGRGVIYTKGGR